MAHDDHIGQLLSHFINTAQIKYANWKIKLFTKRLYLRLITTRQNGGFTLLDGFFYRLLSTVAISAIDHPL